MTIPRLASLGALLAFCLQAETRQAADDPSRVQALLSRNCLKCHGPEQQKNGLRLDSRASAIKGGESGEKAIVPGKSAESDLLRRVRSADPDMMMPPKGKGPRLTAEEIELLRRWIDAGAAWPAGAGPVAPVTPDRPITPEQRAYWAFQPVQKPALPRVTRTAWVRTPIDAFILARLEREGIEPAPEASKPDLIRRVSFDLTGLPPTPKEIDEFTRDD